MTDAGPCRFVDLQLCRYQQHETEDAELHDPRCAHADPSPRRRSVIQCVVFSSCCQSQLTSTIVSTTFSLLAATSNRWAVQKYFFTPPVGSYNSSIYDHVTCEAHRSPFYRCGIPSVDENGTCTIESCQFYPPRGVNRTSCRLPVEVGSIHEDNVTLTGVVGQYAECQQGKQNCSFKLSKQDHSDIIL